MLLSMGCRRIHLDFLSLDSYFDFYTFFFVVAGGATAATDFVFRYVVCIPFFPFFTPYEICVVWPGHHSAKKCLCV